MYVYTYKCMYVHVYMCICVYYCMVELWTLASLIYMSYPSIRHRAQTYMQNTMM